MIAPRGPLGYAYVFVGLAMLVIGGLGTVGVLGLSLTPTGPSLHANGGATAAFNYSTNGQNVTFVTANVFPVVSGTGIRPIDSATFSYGDTGLTFSPATTPFTHKYAAAGTYKVTETLTQTYGSFSTALVSIAGLVTVPSTTTGVVSSGQTVSVSPSFRVHPSALTVNVTDTTQATGASVTGVAFNFGDGKVVTGTAGFATNHTYVKSGTYQLVETVTAMPSSGTCGSTGASACPTYAAFYNVTVASNTTTPQVDTNPYVQSGVPGVLSFALSLALVVAGLSLIVMPFIPVLGARYVIMLVIASVLFLLIYFGSGGPL